MSRMLIIGLGLSLVVHICTGNSWVGSFAQTGTCDEAKCCCAKSPIIITKDGANDAKSTIERKGADCVANTNLDLSIVNATSLSSVDVPNDGLFSLNGNELTVTLVLKNVSNPGCAQIFNSKATVPTGGGNNTNPLPPGSDGSSKKVSLTIQVLSMLMAVSTLSMSR